MKIDPPTVSKVLKNQLGPSFEMINGIITICPDDLWNSYEDGDPIWLHIYHILFSMDFWFGTSQKPVFPDFGKPVTPDMGKKQNDYLAKSETSEYLKKVKAKAEDFISFSDLSDQSLIYDKWSIMDGILEQIRHTQYHIGRCNGILSKHKAKTVGWSYFNPEV